jgi:phage gp29-like protein
MPRPAKPPTPYQIEKNHRAEKITLAVRGRHASLVEEQAVDQLLAWLKHLPDPDETLQSGGLRRTDLRRLLKDDEITQCIDKRNEAVIGTPWRLEPYGSRNSQWLQSELTPHIPDLLNQAQEAVYFGYSVQEIIYTQRGGRIGIDRIVGKPFEWFRPQVNGSLRYCPNDGSGGADGLETDPRKYLLTRHQASYRNPYGEALLSRLWWPVFSRFKLWQYRLQYLERFGMPLVLGKTNGDRAAFASELSHLAANAVAAVSPQDDVTFVETAKDGNQFSQAEAEIIARIQKLILGQTMTSQIGSSGSYAAAKVHYQVMQDKRNADIRRLSSTAQTLINHLWTLNNLPGAAPVFVMADDTGLEKERAERDAMLVEKGILKLTKEYLLDRYDYAEGDFEIPEAAAPPTAPTPSIPANEDDPAPVQKTEMNAAFAPASPKFTARQQVIEDAIDATLGALPSPITNADLQTAIHGATSAEDLSDRLSVVLRDADAHTFGQVFERALFAADIIGYAHADSPPPAIPAAPTPDPVTSLAARLLARELGDDDESAP